MAKKGKKLLKKLAKAAIIGGALYAGAKGLKGRKGDVSKTAATEGIKWTPGSTIPDVHSGLRSNRYKFDTDHLTTPSLAAKGGRIGAKGGGIAKRGIGAAYGHGGRVKSMGIAKRGGGAAKR